MRWIVFAMGVFFIFVGGFMAGATVLFLGSGVEDNPVKLLLTAAVIATAGVGYGVAFVRIAQEAR